MALRELLAAQSPVVPSAVPYMDGFLGRKIAQLSLCPAEPQRVQIRLALVQAVHRSHKITPLKRKRDGGVSLGLGENCYNATKALHVAFVATFIINND